MITDILFAWSRENQKMYDKPHLQGTVAIYFSDLLKMTCNKFHCFYNLQENLHRKAGKKFNAKKTIQVKIHGI